MAENAGREAAYAEYRRRQQLPADHPLTAIEQHMAVTQRNKREPVTFGDLVDLANRGLVGGANSSSAPAAPAARKRRR